MFSSFQVALQKLFSADRWCRTTIANQVLGALTQVRVPRPKRRRQRRAGRCCCSAALALMLTIDRTLNGYLARAQAATDRAARARLLGRGDALAAPCWGVSMIGPPME